MDKLEILFNLQMVLRMIVAAICGIAIGFERKNRAKEAGVRTHCIVAVASCLMMLISKYGFYDVLTNVQNSLGNVKLDPSRMAQGIVTGVGFLGAGIIFVQRGAIKGLTTAAGIWATAGIGMAIGAGMYLVGVVGTTIVLLAQIVLHAKQIFMVTHKQKEITIYKVSEDGFLNNIKKELENFNVTVSEVSIQRNEDSSLDYKLYCDIIGNINEEELIKIIPGECKIRTIS